MTIKHTHPPVPDQEEQRRLLLTIYKALVRKLRDKAA